MWPKRTETTAFVSVSRCCLIRQGIMGFIYYLFLHTLLKVQTTLQCERVSECAHVPAGQITIQNHAWPLEAAYPAVPSWFWIHIWPTHHTVLGLPSFYVCKNGPTEQRVVSSMGWCTSGHPSSRNLSEHQRVLLKRGHLMTDHSYQKVDTGRDFLEMYFFSSLRGTYY